MSPSAKSEKKHFRELSDRCYEIEMSEALEYLYGHFQKWKNKEITIWELNELIHQHHDGTARSLYSFYERINDPKAAVAKGISKGILKIEDVPEESRRSLERLVEYFKNNQ